MARRKPWTFAVRYMPRSVKWRTITLVIFVVSAILTAYGTWLTGSGRRALLEARIEQADVLIATSAKAIGSPLWDFDIQGVQHVLEALRLDPDFVSARVLDPSGRKIASAGRAKPDQRSAGETKHLALSAPIVRQASEDPETLGTLELVISRERIDTLIRDKSLVHAAVSAAALLTLLAVLYAVAVSAMRPLERLKDSITALGDGDLDRPVPGTGRSDEVGAVAIAIEGFRLNAIEVRDLRRIKDKAAGDDRARVHAAVESTQEAVVILDQDGDLVFANRAARRMIPDVGSHKRDRLFAHLGRRNGCALLRAVTRHCPLTIEVEDRATGRCLDIRLSPVRDDANSVVGTVVLLADISDRVAARRQIESMANCDSLTNLPNRRCFENVLRTRLASGRPMSLLLLDLDRFKNVNDTMGHPIGDQLLMQVAERLRGAIRPDDVVARLGGDEFAILVAGKDGDAAALAAAERVIGSFSAPFILDDRQIRSGTSIGVIVHSGGPACATELIRKADLALYRVKSGNRGGIQLFQDEFDQIVRRRQEMEDRLRAALARDELELDFQPQRSLVDGGTIGFEALARWRPANEKPIAPGEFIPIAEESGLIEPLSERLFLQAARVAQRLEEENRPERIAINLSEVLFAQDPVALLDRVCRTAGCAPARLEVEITEAVLLSDTEANKRTLRRIRDMGITVALDDFGMGYSSLATLQTFPMDRLKIDRSFVARLDENDGGAEAYAIIRAIVELGHALGMSVTAEGVETQMQLAKLRAAGCDSVQGYLIGRPSHDAVRLANVETGITSMRVSN